MVIAAFMVITASSSCSGQKDVSLNEYSPRDRSLIIWAHSDIQPYRPEEKHHYEIAVRDIKTLPFIPDMAIVAGDLVHRKQSQEYWDWMKGLRSDTGIPYWFEITGNHDMNDSASYFRNSGKPVHYAVRYGNLLFIFLSDEIRSAVTDISDAAFKWWKQLVIKNRDGITVTVTHAALAQSGLPSTLNWTMNIRDSGRFYEVLKKYPVDLWISAHTHLPNSVAIKTSAPKEFRTLFLDVSSIHKSTGSPVESWILVFRDGSASLLCSPRNHEKGVFYSVTTFRFALSRPFFRGDGKAVMVSLFE